MFGRRADIAYIAFFAAHFLVTAFFDSQHVAPHLAPAWAQQAQAGHIRRTRDPLLSSNATWFTTFIMLELLFVRCSVVAPADGAANARLRDRFDRTVAQRQARLAFDPPLRGLERDDDTSMHHDYTRHARRRSHRPDAGCASRPSVAADQQYAPFLVIALIIMLDMASRLTRLADTAQSSERTAKAQ